MSRNFSGFDKQVNLAGDLKGLIIIKLGLAESRQKSAIFMTTPTNEREFSDFKKGE